MFLPFLFIIDPILDLVWELHVANHFPSVWKPVNAFRLSKRVSEAPAANSLPPNCEAHFATWSGKRRELSTPNREQCCLSSCVQQKNRGNLFEFQSTSSAHTEGWTLHPPPTPKPTTPPHHHHHHPLPPHPNPPSTGGEKNLHTLRSSTVHALFFYLVLVDVMGKLCLSLSPSLPLSPSLRLSCAWDAHALHRAAVARRIQARVLAAILKSPLPSLPPPHPPNNTAGIFEGNIHHITVHSDPVVLHRVGTASGLIVTRH